MIVLLIFYLLSLIQILWDAWTLNAGAWSAWRWSKRQAAGHVKEREPAPALIVMLPVLREQSLLEETLRYFARMPYGGARQVIVLTTEREIAENGGSRTGTTIEVAEQLAGRLNAEMPGLFRTIHYPGQTGNKANQLNYAVRLLAAEAGSESSRTYIGVFDADSRPAPDTFLQLAKLVAVEHNAGREKPIAIQQSGLFLGNFNEVPSWYLRMESLFETRWALGREVRTMRASTRKSPDWRAPYAYCVGHGMFIRQDFLNRSDGFPEPNEDVPMGFRLDLAGIPIHPLPSFDVCDVAPSVRSLIKQSGRWFTNAPLVWKEYQRARALTLPVRPVRAVTLFLKSLNDIFTWMHYPLHFLALLGLLCLGAPPFMVLLSLAAVYLEAGTGMLLMLALLPEMQRYAHINVPPLTFVQRCCLVITSPVRGLIRGLGPIFGLYYGIWALLTGRGIVMAKVERAAS